MLTVDIGNTDIVFGVFENDNLTQTFRVPSKKQEDKIFFQTALANFLLENNLTADSLGVKVLSSVVPELSPVLLDILTQLNKSEVIEVKPGIHPLVKVKIENPDQLGTDLYTNAVSAYHHCHCACIIVDFGTALTFTAVSSIGEVLGVAITPGLKTAINSLFSKTAQLPEVPLELPLNAIGRNTVSSIQSGILNGYEGLVSNIIEKFKKEMNENEIKVFATGGLSSILPGNKALFDEIDIDLTLKGLYIIGKSLSAQ
ncbi:type III pantothenate kinase [Jiulongibacter sediminis]|uniref:Type III pantothenate kinase n=1 Tax=Jiulongibacter sediminis TaxID=1605367 RepID=A0A0P7BRN5_9BACT|nr:type III pantothenate kinase [Jiulongibacter sediminis]KPM47002.1 hypothetical protein AFM12_17390 [Jiulongibacter sediminis]TBX22344.1 hypothetical protein TK44_17395 [Jiulongibacter sediminis]